MKATDIRVSAPSGWQLLPSALLLSCGLLLPSLGAAGEGAAWSAEPGAAIPALSLPDLEGESVALEELEGKVVLVNLWATYCIPCRHEMPLLDELAERHREEGLVVLGISIDRERAEDRVRKLVEELDLSYRILLDPEARSTDLFPAPALPASFLFDSRGRLAWKRHGVIVEDDPELQEALGDALPAEERSTGEGTGSGW